MTAPATVAAPSPANAPAPAPAPADGRVSSFTHNRPNEWIVEFRFNAPLPPTGLLSWVSTRLSDCDHATRQHGSDLFIYDPATGYWIVLPHHHGAACPPAQDEAEATLLAKVQARAARTAAPDTVCYGFFRQPVLSAQA